MIMKFDFDLEDDKGWGAATYCKVMVVSDQINIKLLFFLEFFK